jgi:hypothetical protein
MCRRKKLAITRRIAGDIKDIWALQPRFEQRSGKRPYGVLQQPAFSRPATISCCSVSSPARSSARSASGGRIFLHASDEARAAMLLPQAPGAAKKTPAAVAGQRQTLDRTAASRNESSRLAREFLPATSPTAIAGPACRPDRRPSRSPRAVAAQAATNAAAGPGVSSPQPPCFRRIGRQSRRTGGTGACGGAWRWPSCRGSHLLRLSSLYRTAPVGIRGPA